MFYIQQIQCISPQQTFPQASLDTLQDPVNNKLNVIEPSYDGVPRNALRRMSKSVRIGVGAALPIIKNTGTHVDGIIIGTANGGMEDSIVFLKQVIEFEEGVITPGHFVQSTANATAAQLSLVSANKNYNITHVHRGHAFELALIDAAIQLNENAGSNYLVGGVDEISVYNYKLDELDNWYKPAPVTVDNFYTQNTPGSVAGEAAVMLLATNDSANAIAAVIDIVTLHTTDIADVQLALQGILTKHGDTIDIFLSGENGDNRFDTFYTAVENELNNDVTVARFKHICGEYPTATSFALWFACELLSSSHIPAHAVKKQGSSSFKNVLIYNVHKGVQHSFILVRES